MSSPTDIFRDSVYSVLNSVHTALPGIVKSFDPSTNKATIQPALNKKYVTGPMPMPILENVPVMFPRGGDFSMTFPLKEGDYVLLIFIERSIDLWVSVGGQVTPDDPRKFDLSDAIAIPGIMPFNGSFPENDNESFSLIIGQSRFKISSDGTFCFHNSTNELMEKITEIVTAIEGLQILVSGAAGVVDPTYITSTLAPLLVDLQTFVGDC